MISDRQGKIARGFTTQRGATCDSSSRAVAVLVCTRAEEEVRLTCFGLQVPPAAHKEFSLSLSGGGGGIGLSLPTLGAMRMLSALSAGGRTRTGQDVHNPGLALGGGVPPPLLLLLLLLAAGLRLRLPESSDFRLWNPFYFESAEELSRESRDSLAIYHSISFARGVQNHEN